MTVLFLSLVIQLVPKCPLQCLMSFIKRDNHDDDVHLPRLKRLAIISPSGVHSTGLLASLEVADDADSPATKSDELADI